jgi:hypothetical protein
MGESMDEVSIQGESRQWLDHFFAQIADFMRNTGEE